VIPQKLVLSNFLCYRQAEIDFAGIHVACLAGANGAGKSALLDAITWAIWGNARARRDDELIHLGEKEMAVDLSFQQAERMYRVLRRRKAGKRGSTLLDFQVQADGTWKSIAESGVRATQAKIEHTLHLDYETFVNSAFLRQGHADEFTVKTPAERKRVLGNILGLNRWARYEEQAKASLRAAQDKANLLELRLQEIDEELARSDEYAKAVADAQAVLQERSKRLEQVRVDYQKIEQARAELGAAESQLTELDARMAQTEQELASLEEDREARKKRLADRERLLASEKEIMAGYVAYQEAVGQEQDLGTRLRRWTELQSRHTELDSQLAQARLKLQTDRDVAARHVGELEGLQVDETLLHEHVSTQAQLSDLDRIAGEQEACRPQLAKLAGKQAELRATNEALRPEMETLKERIETLEKAGADCPLCAQPLTDDHRAQMLEGLQSKGLTKGDTYRSNRKALEDLAQEARALEQKIGEQEKLLRDRDPLRRQEAALAARVERGREAKDLLDVSRAALAAAENALENEEYAEEARDAVARVVKEQSELNYDVEAHDVARKAVAEKQAFAYQKALLAAAQAEAEDNRAALERLDQSGGLLRERQAAAQARLAELQEKAKALRQQIGAAPNLEKKLRQARDEDGAARQQLGAAQQRLEASKALEVQRADKIRSREQLAHTQAIYDELKTAFGVRGVPAMVIEAAVPEIEAEANRLLERMTGGRMRVRFDTQRQTQAGEARETLEIFISDEHGPRPYENYSGGEQFRVNFAIRIALSKLLARRAGARLQTLVIDEGFGTQDADGRQRLVEAINVIQSDFARVLVISHIDELKDLFPTRIEVTKTPQGSVVEVR